MCEPAHSVVTDLGLRPACSRPWQCIRNWTKQAACESSKHVVFPGAMSDMYGHGTPQSQVCEWASPMQEAAHMQPSRHGHSFRSLLTRPSQLHDIWATLTAQHGPPSPHFPQHFDIIPPSTSELSQSLSRRFTTFRARNRDHMGRGAYIDGMHAACCILHQPHPDTPPTSFLGRFRVTSHQTR